MKNSIKKLASYLIVALFAAILASTITVFASGMLAGSIEYTNTKTVGGALDDLYSLKTDTVENLIDNKLEDFEVSVSDNIVGVDISPSTTGWQKIADYPSGYSRDNCIIVGGYIFYDNEHQKIILPYSFYGTYNNDNFMFEQRTDGIYATASTAFIGKSGKVYLHKI